MRTALFIMILLAACKQPVKEKEFVYVISKHEKLKPEGSLIYGDFNFIIDTTGNIYYYQLHTPHFGFDYGKFDSFKQPFIFLKTEYIVQIPPKSIIDFVKLNILPSGAYYPIISIAAIKDTIKCKALEDLINIFSDTSYHKYAFIRKASEEEKIVLPYKWNGLIYNAYLTHWDTTIIKDIPYWMPKN